MEAHRSGSQVAVGIWRWALSCAMASSQRPQNMYSRPR